MYCANCNRPVKPSGDGWTHATGLMSCPSSARKWPNNEGRPWMATPKLCTCGRPATSDDRRCTECQAEQIRRAEQAQGVQ